MSRRFLVVFALASVSCVLAALLALVLQPPTFATRRDAIAYVLQRRGLTADEIYLDQRWPDSVNTLVYGANLTVNLRGGASVTGYFECRQGERSCSFSLPRLGLRNEPVPDIVVKRSWPLLDWLEGQVAGLRLIMQSW